MMWSTHYEATEAKSWWRNTNKINKVKPRRTVFAALSAHAESGLLSPTSLVAAQSFFPESARKSFNSVKNPIDVDELVAISASTTVFLSSLNYCQFSWGSANVQFLILFTSTRFINLHRIPVPHHGSNHLFIILNQYLSPRAVVHL